MASSPLEGSDGPLGIGIKVEGRLIGDAMQVASVRVRTALNRIPEAVVVLTVTTARLEDFVELENTDFALGKAVEIAAFFGSGEEQKIFGGIITAYRLRGSDTGGVRFELTCRDKAIALTEVRVSRSYIDSKDSDVMSRIVDEGGLRGNISATKSKIPLTLRVAATGWDYLRLLADRNGYVIKVDDGTVNVAPVDVTVAPSLTVTYGVDIVDIDVTIDAQRMIGGVSTRAWSAKTQTAVQGQSVSPTDSQFGNTGMKKIADVLSSRQAEIATAGDHEQAVLNDYSDARMKRAEAATLRGSVQFNGTGAIAPGDTLEIRGTTNRFSGNAYVSSVEHDLAAGVWSTTVRLGLPQDWTSDQPGTGAPPAQALNAPVHGLQIGKVLQVDDDPDGGQRIKLKLAMIGDPPAAIWARLATPYATKDAGFQFLPEVDDEVVVAFLDADPEAPIIMGSLHNAKAKRPQEAVRENYIKTIVTPQKLRITFDDENKKVVVETPDGRVLTMNDNEKLVSLVDALGNSIEMNSSGITLKSDKDITLTASGKISAQASMDATLSGSNVTCEGDMGFTGKGGSTAEVSSGGMTTVKGSMVNIN